MRNEASGDIRTQPRIIYRSGNADFLQRLLEAICIAELIAPSKELWIYAAWISDFVVLNNRRGTLSGLMADWPQDTIRLSQWLRQLGEAGTTIRLRTNKDSKNEIIRQKIQFISYGLPHGRIRLEQCEDLHDKGMIGDDYYLRGSFNFTRNGVLTLQEHAEYNTDAETVNTAKINARADWKVLEAV